MARKISKRARPAKAEDMVTGTHHVRTQIEGLAHLIDPHLSHVNRLPRVKGDNRAAGRQSPAAEGRKVSGSGEARFGGARQAGERTHTLGSVKSPFRSRRRGG